MKKFVTTAASVGALAAAALGLAGAAAAAPTGGSNAADTVKMLEAEGYHVQLNGNADGPLSRCIVTDVHGLGNSSDSAGRPTRFTTVYVDISCSRNTD